MRDFPFSFDSLNRFSQSNPYQRLSDSDKNLYTLLKQLEVELNFPAIHDDVGSFISFLFHWLKPKRIFEFGSGYGQSCFWYSLSDHNIEKVILTEKREDLEQIHHNLPWSKTWKNKLEYHQKDAFKVFDSMEDFDFILIDGVKADYLEFLEKSYNKLNPGGIVLVDNSYWRGSFLDDEVVAKKKTAANIRALHSYISKTEKFESIFIPYVDGVSLLRKI
jgi:predicted O-methyltransferase YrrM